MAQDGRHRLRWAELNEQKCKGYNERRAAAEEAGEVPPDEPVPFACECDDPGCARAIEIPLGAYERAVAAVERFIVLPGHEDPEVEVVVERQDGYLVVSKPDLARRSGQGAPPGTG
jgi:hypothetical protein